MPSVQLAPAPSKRYVSMLSQLPRLYSVAVPASSRSEHIDIARGWVMILVVMHHAAFLKQPDAFSQVCQALILGFHMPFFFLLNGYLLHMAGSADRYSIKAYLKTRFMRLLVPYFLFELINLALSWLAMPYLHNHLELDKAFLCIVECINDKGVYEGISGRLWFLPCLFFSDMLAFALLKAVKSRGFLTAAAVALAIASYGLHSRYGQRLPLTLDAALMGTCFVLAGYAGRPIYVKYAERAGRLGRALFFALVLLAYLGAVWCNPECIQMFDDRYGNYPLAIAGSVAAFCVVMMLARAFSGRVTELQTGFLAWLRSLSLWYGINSLAVFPIHFWVVNTLKYVMNTQSPANYLLFVIALFATIPVVNFVREFMPFLLGTGRSKRV